MPKQTPPTIGFDPSPSHGISLCEHYRFDEAVFDALWQAGEDIGDADLLVELAADAGVGAEEVRSALADDALRAEVRERFAEAKREGITGVPTFVYDDHAARGAVPPEHLERLVDGV
nr:DsbA family protein [Natronomonas moolapensis]